jgi:hypothetical protein
MGMSIVRLSGRTIFSIDLGRNDRTHLHHDVVGRDLDGSAFHGERVLADPRRQNGMEIGV